MRRRIRGMIYGGSKQYSLDSRLDLVQTFVNNAKARNLPAMQEQSFDMNSVNDDDSGKAIIILGDPPPLLYYQVTK